MAGVGVSLHLNLEIIFAESNFHSSVCRNVVDVDALIIYSFFANL